MVKWGLAEEIVKGLKMGRSAWISWVVPEEEGSQVRAEVRTVATHRAEIGVMRGQLKKTGEWVLTANRQETP